MSQSMSWRYWGLLARPIIISAETDAEEIALAFRRALFKLYRIDPDHEDAERHLLRALITRHVPGFRVKQQGPEAKSKRPGRPLALDPIQRVKLQNKMDGLIAKGPASWLSADPDFAGVNPEFRLLASSSQADTEPALRLLKVWNPPGFEPFPTTHTRRKHSCP
jgi:hypothetical protein